MRKITKIVAIMVILAGVISFSSQAFGQSGSKVLMIPREGYSYDLDLMLKMEVGVMTQLLKKAGFQVDIATTSGTPIIGPTEKIEKVLRLVDTTLDDYKGVIMPCMAVGGFPGPPVSPEAVVIVKKALADGKPVAASTFAVTILADAGLLKGKKYAFPRDPLKTDENFKLTDLRFEGADYGGLGVIQDGKMITSGACAWMERRYGMLNRADELTKTFITALGSK